MTNVFAGLGSSAARNGVIRGIISAPVAVATSFEAKTQNAENDWAFRISECTLLLCSKSKGTIHSSRFLLLVLLTLNWLGC